MKTDRTRALRALCAIGLLACASHAHAGPSLVGDTVQLWSHGQSNGIPEFDAFGIVQDPGHEFTFELLGSLLFTLDVGPDSIRLDTGTEWFSPWFNTGFGQTYQEIRDLDWSGPPGTYIVDVIVTYSSNIVVESGAPDDLPEFSAGNVSFTADSVRIITGGYRFLPGSFVHVELVTAPGPGTAVALGVFGVLSARRRRSA